ncbi:MAG: sigma-70 family RNA polymerase sigma factor [Polyangiales bacterium]
MIDDPTLCERAQRGEPEAIASLLIQAEPDLRRFAARVCSSRADADDAVQHAMITVSFRLGSFRGLARLSTWLFSVIRNECRKYERVARRWVFGAQDEHPAPEAHAEDGLEAHQSLAALTQAIRALPAELRAVFVLRELEELSTAECAERLAISEANVKVRLHRARRQLRGALDGSG